MSVNPTRITMALNIRGLRAGQVDRACGGDVLAWEAGDVTLTDEQLAALADLAVFPLSWFRLPDPDEPVGWLVDAGRRTAPWPGGELQPDPPGTTWPPYRAPCVAPVRAAFHEPADAGGWRPCGATPTRRYLTGDRCQAHTPAALAGEPEAPRVPAERRWHTPPPLSDAEYDGLVRRAKAELERRASNKRRGPAGHAVGARS